MRSHTLTTSIYEKLSTSGKLLWGIQGAFAALFLVAGVMKLVTPTATLDEQSALPVLFMRFIGLCEALGGIGLVLPGVLRIRVGLVPLAAAGLAIIMAGATVVTAVDIGVAPAVMPFVIGALCVFVAVSRSRATVTQALAERHLLQPAS
ncbi:MAG: DoxX family protein [Dehalococcoidia bacterium]